MFLRPIFITLFPPATAAVRSAALCCYYCARHFSTLGGKYVVVVRLWCVHTVCFFYFYFRALNIRLAANIMITRNLQSQLEN